MTAAGDAHVCLGTRENTTQIVMREKDGHIGWRMIESYKTDGEDWLMFDCGEIRYCPWCGKKLAVGG